MKYRVFKKQDGGIIYSYPSSDFQNIPNFEGCRFPDYTDGLEYVDIESDEAPDHQKYKDIYIESFYFDGDCTKENLKQDVNWEVQLMPDFLIKSKLEKKINDDLDTELAKDSPDLITLTKSLRKKELLRDQKDSTVLAQMALDALDSRVSNGESDKPVIRQKLEQKINS